MISWRSWGGWRERMCVVDPWSSVTCTCRVSMYLPVLFLSRSLSLSDTHKHTHKDLHFSKLSWQGLGEKRQSSVPWRWSSSSGQDSARCNPSQVMLFTFSRFQLICLNMPSSSPKKPPPLSPQHNLQGWWVRRTDLIQWLFSIFRRPIPCFTRIKQTHFQVLAME